MRFFIILTLVVASAFADGTGSDHHSHDHQASASTYGAPAAPATGYGAPSPQDPAPTYGAPTYSAPASSYGAPAPSYDAPDSYGAPQQEPVYNQESYAAPSAPGYSAPEEGYGAPIGYEAPQNYEVSDGSVTDLFDISKLVDFLPLVLSILAAVVVAQIFSPLLGVLFGAKLDIFNSVFAPVGNVKIDLINAVLQPFSLALCNIGAAVPVVAGNNGRSLQTAFNVNPDTVDLVANMVYSAMKSYQ